MGLFNIDRIRNETDLASIDYHTAIDSTNSEAIRRIKKAAETGTAVALPLLVLTEQQTSGRGQFDRIWHSSDGSLTLSICLSSSLNDSVRILPLVIGLSVCEAIRKTCSQIEPGLKWPNDILFGGKKLGGVLVERVPFNLREVTAPSNHGGQYCSVIGIGINANNDVSTSPSADIHWHNTFLVQPACLREITGHAADLTGLTIAVVNRVLENVSSMESQSEKLLESCHQQMVFNNHELSVLMSDGELVRGQYAGLGAFGELLIATGAEIRKIVSAKGIRWTPAEKF